MLGHYFSIPSEINWTDIVKKTLLILLLPVFFTLKGYNENFALIPPGIVVGLLLNYIIISLIVFIFSLLLFRRLSKASLFSLYLLGIFFFFGAFHDFLKGIFKPGFIISYTFLLSLIFLFSAFVFFLLRKGNKRNAALLKYCTYLLVILTVLETGTFVYKLFDKSINNLAAKPIKTKSQSDSCLSISKPDIFFVVLDEYTSSKCLQEEFGFSNKYIDSLLKSNHFFISTNSQSNYNFTPLSLTSTFNVSYLKPGLENRHNPSKLYIQGIETFKDNVVTGFFKKEGYLLKNFGCFDLNDAPIQTKPFIKNYKLSRLINDQTIYARILRDIGWNFISRNTHIDTFKIPKEYKENKEYHIYRNQYNWDNLMNEIRNESNLPRFVFAHVMLPHGPFYLNKDGSMVPDSLLILNKIDTKTAYINQVQYTNRLLESFIPLVSKSTKRERVVIIEGDHGFRDHGPEISTKTDFMNLNTYYFSDHDYSMLYDSISPINSFRVILNKYFCQSFPLLKDSTIYIEQRDKL